MDLKTALQIAGVILGLLYLYLEYRTNVLLWIVGIIMPTVHGVLYFKSGLYADAGMQCYYVIAGLWGFCAWLSADRHDKPQKAVSHCPSANWIVYLPVLLLATAGLWLLLEFCTDSTVPFWDAFTTGMSIIALWMLSRKYAEQWLVWCVVDVVSAALYFYKDIPFTACLYLFYAVFSVIGFRKWSRMA